MDYKDVVEEMKAWLEEGANYMRELQKKYPEHKFEYEIKEIAYLTTSRKLNELEQIITDIY